MLTEVVVGVVNFLLYFFIFFLLLTLLIYICFILIVKFKDTIFPLFLVSKKRFIFLFLETNMFCCFRCCWVLPLEVISD